LGEPPHLEGRIAIVTGGGQGMGLAFSRALAAAGARVAVAEINEATGRQAVEGIVVTGGDAIFYKVDVRDGSQVQTMVDDLLARWGRVDILINNAGVAAGGPSEDVTEEEWDRVIGIMFKGAFQCAQIAGRVMLAQGSGVVLNICSMAGLGGWAQRALYTPAKAAMIALTNVLGCEWASRGVRVVGINPGQIDTPLNNYVFERKLADREVFTNRAPMRRFGTPEEMADAILFLVSDEARHITAEVVTIDGGWMAWGGIAEPIGA
jgi:NAD(P)-dependent dehydrogenase (short-subunit alcohol dehydrogenase family)